MLLHAARLPDAARIAAAAGVATMLLAGVVAGIATGPAGAQLRQPRVVCSMADHSFLVDLAVPLQADGSPDRRGMDGSLDIHHQKLSQERRRWSLARRQPTQLWLHANDLRLKLVLGTGDELMEVVIETMRRSPFDAEYAGSIALRAAEGVRLAGRITCAAE